MRKFVYPAVIYYDDDIEQYILCIEDIGVYAYGTTMEEAHKKGEELLATFISYSLKFDCDIPEPTSYVEMKVKYTGKDIILVEVTFDEKNRYISA